MYEAVYAYPGGDSTVSRYAKTAAEYGYEGIVVRTRHAEYDRAAIDARYGIDVVEGIEIDAANPQSASGAIGEARERCTLLLLRGGTNAMNRFAVEQDRIDVLSRPMTDDGDVNHVIAKAAAEHGVRIEFDLGPVLRRSGGYRVRTLRRLTKLFEIVDHYDAPYVVSSTPHSHLQLRSERELRAVGEAIGFDPDWITEGLEEWRRLTNRNRDRHSEEFIGPGVKMGRYEANDR